MHSSAVDNKTKTMTLMNKSQSLATLLYDKTNEEQTKPDMTNTTCFNNGFVARSSSKTTEQMVRSIQIDLDGDQNQLFMINTVNDPNNDNHIDN